MRELLEVLQAAGLRQLEPGHLGHGRRRQLLLPPVSSPQPAPRQGGSGGREGAGRRQRGDVEQQRLGEATICACMDPSIQEGKRRKAPVRSREQDARRERNQQMLHGRPLYSHLWPSRADALLPNGGNRKHTGMGGSETDSPGRGPGSGTTLATRAAASQTGQLARDRCCLSPLARSARNAGTAYFISDTITI